MHEIYIAGKYEDRRRVKRLATILEKHGHHITFRWYETKIHKNRTPHELLFMDINGIVKCDTFIILFPLSGIPCGALIELGVAYSHLNCKRHISIGKYPYSSYMFLGIDATYKSVHEFIKKELK